MEQGFWSALFSTKIESATGAQKILKVTFVFCSVPLLIVIFFNLFLPDLFYKSIAKDQTEQIIAYVFSVLMLALGGLVLKKLFGHVIYQSLYL